MIFQRDQLLKFLRHIRAHFSVMPLCDYESGPALLLRHDVDLDVTAAHRLALIEYEEGVRSTFLFMTTCDSYNVLSARNRQLIREMAELGFDIGLHFDPLVYGSHGELDAEVQREAAIIASVTGRKVRSISIHNPSALGHFPLFSGFVNAYDPRLFDPSAYASDSRMQFRHDIYQLSELAAERCVQILLHPLHYTKAGVGYADIFSEFVLDFVDQLDANFRANSQYDLDVRPHLRAVLSRALVDLS